MRERWLAGFGLLAMLVVSCSGASPSGSQVPVGSIPEAESQCVGLEISGPSGRNIELTGAWRGDDVGWYDILQRESCFYWMGMSQDHGSGLGHDWTNVFTGTIQSDFTIAGDWGDVPFNPEHSTNHLSNGSLVLQIEFDTSSEVERPVLRRVADSGFFGGSTWVLEESLSDPVELAGTFGGDDGQQCVWVEADGERVEMVGSGVWTYRSPPLSIQDDTGHILARIGDPIVVRGQLSTALGGRCTDTSILVEELDPTP